ncbi:MAG: fumarylacetoacetate hydrolase family protein, partial [Oscillospiraceae bacterium]|nr:fumarylacetoacetate hydrolase family protein [Oscillospiraceae bacterium]
MKFLCYRHTKEKPVTIGIMFEGDENIYPISLYDLEYTSMIDLIRNITPAEKERLIGMPKPLYGFVPLTDVIKVSPVPYLTQDVICLGINYMEHAEESARFKKETFAGERPHAVYFSKRVNEPVPDGGAVNGHFDIVDSLDYEVELAVILGKDAYQVRAEDALEYVFGYTILNDISARNLQTRHSQWYFGKSLDSFCPLGPYIVTADSFEFEPKLAIRSYVNGE